MDARVYIPSLGRFLQADPIDGGTLNAYVYVADPINSSDYNGRWGLGDFFAPLVQAVRAFVQAVVAPVGGILREAAWRDVVIMEPRANTNALKDQFVCHWDIVSIVQPGKESWNLDIDRPDAGYWNTITNGCNPH